MAIDQTNRETAYEVYKKGYRDRFYTKESPKSKLFFVKLRNAVVEELESTGFCELVDYILESKRGKIDIVVYSVLADIASGYEKQTMADVKNDPEYYEFIPHIKGGRTPSGAISWAECVGINDRFIALTEGTLETIRKARQVVRMNHVGLLGDNSSEYGQEPETQVYDAQKEAERIMEEAKRESDRIINESRLEGEKILESAQTSASSIISDATSKASEKAKESADRLIERYLSSEQKRFKGELNEELSRKTSEFLDFSKRTAATHAEMCDATNAFQVKWVQTLDEAINRMTSVKAEFYTHIHDWQVSLYPREIKPLAERYLELYKIINVDRLLREAILFNNNIGDETSQTETFNQEEGDAFANASSPDVVIMGLQRLNRTLTTFLRRFEVALNGLDLYVFYPNVGDEFDDMWHIPDDEDEEYYGKRIKECVVPGIAKKANDDLGDDVLIPAVVRVEMEN